jgi:hypothetical protein
METAKTHEITKLDDFGVELATMKTALQRARDFTPKK